MFCPNKNLKEWQDLVKIQGEDSAYYLWNKYKGAIPDVYYYKKVSDISEENINKPKYYLSDEESVKTKIDLPKVPVQTVDLPINAELVNLITPVLNELNSRGFNSLIVGGAVRDALLGNKPKDIDIEIYGTTLEELEQVLVKYGKVDAVGKSFGILKFIPFDENGQLVEIEEPFDFSVPRRENKVGVGYTGFEVEFSPDITIEEAGTRRDFTWNSIGYNPITKTLYDYHGGLNDLAEGIIRHVSPKFAEDPLRIFRAMQFQARMGHVIAPETYELMRSLVEGKKEKINIDVDVKIKSSFDETINGLQPESLKEYENQISSLIELSYKYVKKLIAFLKSIFLSKNYSKFFRNPDAEVVIIAKPLGYELGATSLIERFIRDNGGIIEEQKEVIVDSYRISKHYGEGKANFKNKSFFSDLVEYYTGKKVKVYKVKLNKKYIPEMRALIGHSSRFIEDEHSLRKAIVGERYKEILENEYVLDNGIHMSDSVEEGERESNIWFGTPQIITDNKEAIKTHVYLWKKLQKVDPNVQFSGGTLDGTEIKSKPTDLDYRLFSDNLEETVKKLQSIIPNIKYDRKGIDEKSGLEYYKFEYDFPGGKADIAVVPNDSRYTSKVSNNHLTALMSNSWKLYARKEKERFYQKVVEAEQKYGKDSIERKKAKENYENIKELLRQQVNEWFSTKKAFKPYDELMKFAQIGKDELDSFLDSLDTSKGLRIKKAPLKSLKSLQLKADTKYYGRLYKAGDIARATIVLDSKGDLRDQINYILDKLKNEFHQFTVDNYFIEPLLGYKGINISLLTKNDGRVELQINTPEMIFLKETAQDAKLYLGEDLYQELVDKYGEIGGLGHILYDEIKLAKEKNDEEQLRKLEQESIDYYTNQIIPERYRKQVGEFDHLVSEEAYSTWIKRKQELTQLEKEGNLNTPELINEYNQVVGKIPKERINAEFVKWARKGKYHSKIFDFLRQTGLGKKLYPEFLQLRDTPQDEIFHPEGDVEEHTKQVLAKAAEIAEREKLDPEQKEILLLAALFHDIAKPETTKEEYSKKLGRVKITAKGHEPAGEPKAKAIMNLLGFKKETQDIVGRLIGEHLAHATISAIDNEKSKKSAFIKLINRIKPATVEQLMLLMEADMLGRNNPNQETPPSILEFARLLEEFKKENQGKLEFKPILTGKHLISKGLKPGKEFGKILALAKEAQLNLDFTNESEALEWLNNYLATNNQANQDDIKYQASTSPIQFGSIEEGISWIKQVMPDANIELVDELINGIGRGSYNTTTDLITLSKKYADKKTAKHEIFHAAWNRLSKEKQEELLNEGSKLFGIARGKSNTDKKSDQIVVKDNQSPTDKYTGDLAIEEKIAEMMENTPDEHIPKTPLGKWIQSVKNFFRNLFKERTKIERFLRDVNQGRIKKQSRIKRVLQKVDKSKVNPNTLNKIKKLHSFRDNPNYGVFLEKGEGKLYQSLYHLHPDITDKEVRQIYDNYVALMGRNKDRVGKEMSFETFQSLLDSYQVINYKNTYIFGQYVEDKKVFVSRVNSSPSSKELLAEAIPFISKNFDVISFLPSDMKSKYERSGYIASTASFKYDFKGEEMYKFALFSNADLPKRVFGKNIEDITASELENFNDIPLTSNSSFYKGLKGLEKLSAFVNKANKLRAVSFKMKYELEDNYYTLKFKEEGLTDEEIGYFFNWVKKLKIEEADTLSQIYSRIQLAELHGGILKDAQILSEKADLELNERLKKWASQFGIEVRSIEEFRKRTGKDAIAVADTLNKIIYYNSKLTDVTTFPEEIAHFYVEMLGSRHPLFKDAYSKIVEWSEYASIFEEYKDVYVKPDGTPDVFKIKKEAIGKAIAQRIVGKSKVKKSKFWAAIDAIIAKIKQLFGNDISKFNIELIADEIANDILTNTNKYLGFGSFEGASIPSNFELKSFEDTISKNPKLLEIVKAVSEMGGVLTGSLAYRKQGTTYRKTSEVIHDLDFKIPYEAYSKTTFEDFIKQAKEKFGLVRSIKTNGEFNAWEEESGKYISIGYVGGTRVSNWKELGYYNESETLWFDKDGNELNEPRLLETGELAFDGISIDFFFEPEGYDIEVDSDNYALWTNAFQEKIKMGRDKDAFDYRTFIPLPEFRNAKIREEFLYYQLSNDRKSITIDGDLAELLQQYNIEINQSTTESFSNPFSTVTEFKNWWYSDSSDYIEKRIWMLEKINAMKDKNIPIYVSKDASDEELEYADFINELINGIDPEFERELSDLKASILGEKKLLGEEEITEEDRQKLRDAIKEIKARKRKNSTLGFIEIDNARVGIQLNATKNIKNKTVNNPTQSLNAVTFGGYTPEFANNIYNTIAKLAIKRIKEKLPDFNDFEGVRSFIIKLVKNRVGSSDFKSYSDMIMETLSTNSNLDHPAIFNIVISAVNSFFDKETIRLRLPGTEYIVASNTVEVYDVIMDGKEYTMVKPEIDEHRAYGRDVRPAKGNTFIPRPLKQQEFYYREVYPDGTVSERLSARDLPETKLMEQLFLYKKGKITKDEIDNFIAGRFYIDTSDPKKAYNQGKVLQRNKLIEIYENKEGKYTDIDTRPAEVGMSLTQLHKFGIRRGMYLSNINENFFTQHILADKKKRKALLKRLNIKEAVDGKTWLKNAILESIISSPEFFEYISTGDPKKLNAKVRELLADFSEKKYEQLRKNELTSVEKRIATLEAMSDEEWKKVNYNSRLEEIAAAKKLKEHISAGKLTGKIKKDFNKYKAEVEKTIENVIDALEEQLFTYAEEINASWKEYIRQIGVRIPGQGHQSMMGIKIAYITHDQENTIYLPTESKWYKGEDEDIDKEPVIGYFVNDEGLIKWNSNMNILDKSTWNEPTENDTDEEIINWFIYNMNQGIHHPANIQLRETPMEMTGIKKASELSPKGQRVQQLHSLNVVDKHLTSEGNMIGKDVIGVVAVGLKAYSALTTAYNNNPDSPYLVVKYDGKPYKFRGIERSLLANVNWSKAKQDQVDKLMKSLKTNKTKFANYTFQEILEEFALQDDAVETLSQLLSAATDNAKELILDKLNVTVQTAGMFSFLLTVNVPFNTIVEFFTSPIFEFVLEESKKNIFKNEKYLSMESIIESLLEGDEKIVSKFKEVADLNSEETQLFLNDFKVLLKIGESFRKLGDVLALNQGLPNDPISMLKYKKKFVEYIKEVVPDFSFEEFINNPEAAESYIKEYEKHKSGYNILFVINNVPHFNTYLKMYEAADKIHTIQSYKYALASRLIDKLVEYNYYAKAATIPNNVIEQLFRYIDQVIIDEFLKSKSSVTTYNYKGKTYNIASDKKGFMKWVTEEFIKDIKTLHSEQPFLLELATTTSKRYGNLREIRPGSDTTGLTDEHIQMYIDSNRKNFDKLKGLVDSYGNDVYEILKIYNLIVNNDGNRKESLSKFYTNKHDIHQEFNNFIPENKFENDSDLIDLLEQFVLINKQAITPLKKAEEALEKSKNEQKEIKVPRYAKKYSIGDFGEGGSYSYYEYSPATGEYEEIEELPEKFFYQSSEALINYKTVKSSSKKPIKVSNITLTTSDVLTLVNKEGVAFYKDGKLLNLRNKTLEEIASELSCFDLKNLDLIPF